MKRDARSSKRPAGRASRVREGPGKRSRWIAPNGQSVQLPLIFDHIEIDPYSGEQTSCVEATIDLVDGIPSLIEVTLQGQPCLNPVFLQRFFRWATPLEVVRVTIPQLLEQNINPFDHEYATDGYPEAAEITRRPSNKLSDAFLEEIARQYYEIGHGYARTIAEQRGVSKRTVVSWVEKARKRGFIAETTSGRRSSKAPARGKG